MTCTYCGIEFTDGDTPVEILVERRDGGRGVRHVNPPGWLWRVEVGFRAALHTETLPRDMRWWRGYWDRTKWRR